MPVSTERCLWRLGEFFANGSDVRHAQSPFRESQKPGLVNGPDWSHRPCEMLGPDCGTES